MANIIEIKDFSAPELDLYARLNENQLLRYYEPQTGLFIAESPNVIMRALQAGYEPVSFLLEKKHIETQAKDLLAKCPDVPAYVAEFDVLTKLTGFVRIDGLMGIGVAAFILYSGAMLVKDTINPLLGAAPDSDLVEHIEKKALSYPGVLGVHDLMIHDYGPGSRLVSFHLEMDAKDDVMHSHDVIDRIERDLLVEDGLIATIHFDPVVTGDPHADELKAFLQREVEELAPLANIHDLRIVPGPTHTNVIFDCAVPAEYMTDKQHRGVKLVNALRNAVQAKWPDHFCVIKLEPDYAPVHHE